MAFFQDGPLSRIIILLQIQGFELWERKYLSVSECYSIFTKPVRCRVSPLVILWLVIRLKVWFSWEQASPSFSCSRWRPRVEGRGGREGQAEPRNRTPPGPGDEGLSSPHWTLTQAPRPQKDGEGCGQEGRSPAAPSSGVRVEQLNPHLWLCPHGFTGSESLLLAYCSEKSVL